MKNNADIFSAPAPRFFSMEAGRPFLIDLARVIHNSVESEPGAALSDTLILLPTRRAVRSLADAFLETAQGGKATLLPNMKALGDVDEDEFAVFAGNAQDEIDLPPAISSMQRRLALAKMVAARDKTFDGQERWAGALAAADELAKLLDSFYTEEISPDKLRDIVPDTHAKHWAHSLEFLSIVTETWPAYLAELGLTDPAPPQGEAYRPANQSLGALAAAYARNHCRHNRINTISRPNDEGCRKVAKRLCRSAGA